MAEHSGTSRRMLAAAVVLVVVAPWLGVFRPDAWVDECLTWEIATANLSSHLHQVYSVYDHPPLYFHVAWLWGRVSDSLAYLRGLSALAVGAAGCLLLFRLRRGAGSGDEGGVTPVGLGLFALGFAFAPAILFQGSNLRHYGFFLLVGSGYLLALERAVRTGKTGDSVASALLAGAALLTHHFALFLVVPTEAVALAWRRRASGDSWKRWGAMRLGAASPLLAAWVAIAVRQFPGSGGEQALLMMSGGSQGFLDLVRAVGEYHGVPRAHDVPGWAGWVALGLGVPLVGADLVQTIRVRHRPERVYWCVAAYGPPLLVYGLTFWRPVIVGRFLIVSGAAMWVMHVLTFSEVRRGLRVASGAAMVVLIGMGAWLHSTCPKFPPYAEYVPRILRTVQPGEVLVLIPGMEEAVFQYYARRDGVAMPATVPIPLGVNPDFESILEDLPERLAPYRRAWVVYEFPGLWDPGNRIQHFFETRWVPSAYYQPLWGRRWVVTYYENPKNRPPGERDAPETGQRE